MESLKKSGLRNSIEKFVIDEKTILGVCVGMQIMAESSEEGKEKGLSWIGGVRSLVLKNLMNIIHYHIWVGMMFILKNPI